MYIAAGQGKTTPGDNFLISTGTSCHFGHLLQVSKKSLWSLILYSCFVFFMILYMYIAPGQGQTAPRWQSFDVSRNVLSLHAFAASFKKCLWSLTSYIFLHDLIHVYSPGAGQTAPRGQKLDVNRKTLSLHPFVASFKEISLKTNVVHCFHDLIHVYSPGVGGIQPPGDKVLMSTETSCHFGHLLLVSNHRRQ